MHPSFLALPARAMSRINLEVPTWLDVCFLLVKTGTNIAILGLVCMSLVAVSTLCTPGALTSACSISEKRTATPNGRRRVQAVTGNNGLGLLILPNGSRFQTTLYHLKVLGELPATAKLPYYILSGVGCHECDANTSIYIHSPSNGPMKGEGTQARFAYPGRESHYMDQSLLYVGRMFFGDCVAGHPDAAVWFERFLGSDQTWHSDVFVAEVKKDDLVTGEIKRAIPSITEAEKSVAWGKCQEVPGINRLSEP